MSATRQNQNVFLERRSYRKRRMMDALRLLPVLGLLLWMLPIFWPSAEAATGSVALSVAVTYVFAVWIVLIAIAFALSLVTRQSRQETDPAIEP